MGEVVKNFVDLRFGCEPQEVPQMLPERDGRSYIFPNQLVRPLLCKVSRFRPDVECAKPQLWPEERPQPA